MNKKYTVLFIQKILWIFFRVVLPVFVKLKVEGLNNIDNIKTPVILASNHMSQLDPILIPASLPFWSRLSPIFYVVREQSFYESNGWIKHLFNRSLIEMIGGYQVQVGLNDYEKSLSKHIEMLRKNSVVCIFPEGGISDNSDIRQPKGGISVLSEKGNADIIPIKISGSYKISTADFLFKRKTIKVIFGPVISRNILNALFDLSDKKNTYKAQAQYVMDTIYRL